MGEANETGVRGQAGGHEVDKGHVAWRHCNPSPAGVGREIYIIFKKVFDDNHLKVFEDATFFESQPTAMDIMQQKGGIYMASLDLADAYYSVPIAALYGGLGDGVLLHVVFDHTPPDVFV